MKSSHYFFRYLIFVPFGLHTVTVLIRLSGSFLKVSWFVCWFGGSFCLFSSSKTGCGGVQTLLDFTIFGADEQTGDFGGTGDGGIPTVFDFTTFGAGEQNGDSGDTGGGGTGEQTGESLDTILVGKVTILPDMAGTVDSLVSLRQSSLSGRKRLQSGIESRQSIDTTPPSSYQSGENSDVGSEL